MGWWSATIRKPPGSPSTRLTTAALCGSWAVGCARMSSSWSAMPWRPRRPRGWQGAKELAGAWGDALGERGWAGDEELVAELDAALGRRPAPPGTPLLVDLEELSGP